MNHNDTNSDGTVAGQSDDADLRDNHAYQRDGSAVDRDDNGTDRDRLADDRDRDADQRDHDAEQFEATGPAGMTAEAHALLASARGAARSDRTLSSADRRAGAIRRRYASQDRDAATADREASARERHSAAVDSLTGVYGRHAGFAELDREVARAQRTTAPLVVAFLDVDHLKSVNDSQGHAAGDALLIAVAAAVRAELRPYDLIFRYGGDELVCALPGVREADATRRFELVNATLAAAVTPGSVTVGITELQRDDSAQVMVARADAALYRARRP